MKKSNIIAGTAAIVAILAVTGIAASTYAADDAGSADSFPFMERMGRVSDRFESMTDEEKAELKARFEERHAGREERHEAVEAAMEAEEYSAWVEAVGADAPILEKVNADNFDRLVEAHNLREQARTIMEDELGIERPDWGKKGMRGMHRFMAR